MEFDPEATIAYLDGKVDEYVKRQGRDTVAMNAERDRDARYARIPDGNACDFCRMLGSRGFVYHSEELAGGTAHGTKWDTYHPYCNCQIAVSFDYVQDEYYKNGVKVRRGYADDGIVTVTGRDGSDRMRKVDIDALYDEYLAAGKSYTASAKRLKAQQSARNLMGGTKLPPDEFQAAMQRLADAKTLDELHAVGQDIVDKWPRNQAGRNPEQWREMSELAQRLEREMGNEQIHREHGAYLGALDDSNDPYSIRRDAHAERYYESVRKRDKDTEISTIAVNSGLDESVVSKAYQHLFINEHDLEKGHTRFDPSYDIAQSWQRLREGKSVQKHDITLLKHEAYESDLMRNGMSYEEAHEKAQERYNYAKELKKFLKGGM